MYIYVSVAIGSILSLKLLLFQADTETATLFRADADG